MPKPTKPPLRAKRPRAEVQEEFAEIRGEVEAAKKTAEPKREESLRQQEADVRAAVDGLSVEGVVRKMSGLGLEISKALNGLSDKLAEEVNRLSSVRQAVELEQKELQRLHKIDIGATALDQLVQDYRLEKDRQDAEIAAQRAAWEEESQRFERERKENEENLKKLRQREIDDYEYKKSLERKRAQDKYDEEVRVVEKKNKEKQEALEKDWKPARGGAEGTGGGTRAAAKGVTGIRGPSSQRIRAGRNCRGQSRRSQIRPADSHSEERRRSRRACRGPSDQDAGRNHHRPVGADRVFAKTARPGQTAGTGNRSSGHRRGVGRQSPRAHQSDRDGAGETAVATRMTADGS